MSAESLVDTLLTVPASDSGVAATPAPLLAYTAPNAPFAERNAQVVAITSWWLQRMVAAEHGLTERMTWFWHGHWATSRTKVRETGLMLAQNQTLRQTALGDFGAQARALVVDPAMLLWLDGQRNTKASPNENLSREFLERFTLGAGNYTEDDVREAARALTGWRIAGPTNGASVSTAFLDPKRHDTTPASVLGGQISDANGLADLAVARPECPAFLATRLWFRFVSSTEPLPEPTRQRVLAALGERRDIAAGLRALVSDPTFTDPRYELVKSPVEWLVGAARALQVPLKTLAQNNIRSNLTAMGQIPFEPPSVGGWPAGRGWLTTTSAQRRLTVARLISAAVDRSWLDGLPRGQRADAIADRLGIAWLSPNTREVIAADAGGSERQLTLALISPEYVVNQ